jgi:hypothetical protein
VNRGLYRILWRAFYTSIAIWVPVPGVVWTILASNAGLDQSDPRNFELNMLILVVFAVMITIPSWLLALVLENLGDK